MYAVIISEASKQQDARAADKQEQLSIITNTVRDQTVTVEKACVDDYCHVQVTPGIHNYFFRVIFGFFVFSP